MTFKLPFANFVFIDNENIKDRIFNEQILKFTKQDFNYIFDQSDEIGYIFEVDLHYPHNLHDLHIGLPLAPVHKDNKLIPCFEPIKNYKIHYITLRLYVKLGLKVKKIHQILKFDQKPWLNSYIQTNTEIRKKATLQSVKDNAKLMNNAVYGILTL